MPDQPDKPFNLWQEFKRRKVFRVVAMYAGAAYIIIELVNNVAAPLNLPGWTPTLVILLLAIGFPIVAILSWIFDMTPGGLVKTEPAGKTRMKEPEIKAAKRKLKVSDGIIAALVVVICILLYPKIFKSDKIENLRSKGEISVAVMPFQNMSGDESKNFWQEMIQDNLITSLSNAEALKVRQTETITTLLQNTNIKNYAAITPAIASSVSQKLDASVFVHGSINQAGDNIRLNAKLVDSETEEVFKSFQIDGIQENILYLTDSLSLMVKDYLIVSILKMELSPDLRSLAGTTKSPEALRYALDATKAFTDRNYSRSAELLQKALQIDSNYTVVMLHIALAYGNQGLYDEAKEWTLKAYKRKDNMSRLQKLYADQTYAMYFGTPQEIIKYFRQALEMDDQQAMIYYNLGLQYNRINQYEKAIPEFERALEIYDSWDIKPLWVYNYTALGLTYHKLGLYRKEKNLYRKAEQDFPDDRSLIFRQAILALSQGKEAAANEYIDRFVSLREESSFSKASTAYQLGNLYWAADQADLAEEQYRKVLSLAPENLTAMNNLAFFLIDSERNVDEGIELINKVLESRSDHYNYLDTRGWGLYKLGKYQEALEVLEKSWDKKHRYSHDIYTHLEEVKKAIAQQNN